MDEKQQEMIDNKNALKKEIPVYSEKYGVHGKVLDYGVVTKLRSEEHTSELQSQR